MADLRRSLLITFFSSSGTAFLNFVVSLIMARMLSPHDIGVFSMSVVFVNIAHMFRDFGVATYVQREPDLTVDKMRSAMGVMFVSAWSIALLLLAASEWLGRYFGEPGMVPVMRVLALGFLLIPFGSITQSLLIRQLAAEKQVWITAAGTVSYAGSCLLLAWLGLGAMSLAWANLVNIAACVLVCLFLRLPSQPWLPSLQHWRSVARFGAATLAANCADAINNAMPDILLGKLGNARHVGLFSRANSTVSLFSYVAGATINYGAVSYLSASHHRGEALAPVLRRATALLTGIGWPAFAVTALTAPDLVAALYGAGWLECVPAVAPLALAAAAAMAFQYQTPALTAIGRPALAAAPLLATITARIAFALLFFDGSLVSFAWVACVATLVSTPLSFLYQRRYLGVAPLRFVAALVPSALVALACAATCLLLQRMLPLGLGPVPRLALLVPPLAAVWYAGLHLTRHALLAEVQGLAAGLRARLPRLG